MSPKTKDNLVFAVAIVLVAIATALVAHFSPVV